MAVVVIFLAKNLDYRGWLAVIFIVLGIICLERKRLKDFVISRTELKASFEKVEPPDFIKSHPLASAATTEMQMPAFPEVVAQQEKLDEFLFTLNILENLGIAPDAPQYFYRGLAYFYRNNYERALEAFEMSLHLKPNVFEVMVNKGVILSLLSRYEEALRILIEADKIHKDDPDVLLNMANVYMDLEAKEEALRLYDRIEQLNPTSPRVLVSLGIALKNIGKLDKALGLFDRSLLLKKDNADAWRCKGAVFHELKQQEKELAAYNEVLKISPCYAEVLYNSACIYALRNDTDNALVYLAKAVANKPEMKEEAKVDTDFKDLWQNTHFKIITA